MATDKRFEELSRAMGAYGLEDYKKMLAARRKGLNGARSDIPARLDELNKGVEELSKLDFAALERERAAKQSARDALRAEIEASYKDSEADKLEGELFEARTALQKLEAANAAHRQSQEKPDSAAELDGIRRTLANLAVLAKRRDSDIRLLRDRETALAASITAARDEWDAADAEQFHGESCPTCGQKLPADMLKEAMERFGWDKRKRKDALAAQAQKDKELLESTRQDLADLERQAEADRRERERLEGRLRGLAEGQTPEIADLPSYEADRASLEHQMEDLKGRLESRANAAALRRKALQEDERRACGELDELGRDLAKRDALTAAQARMEELRDQAAKAARELEELDRLLDLTWEFTRYKVRFVEDSINRRFELVRFRLFRAQINGGTEDCCDVTVGGVPYDGGLNNGARINAGVDIINALSRHYDAWVPLFVDNAESVTKLERAGTQVIRLVVSENDKELRCELQ